MRILELVNRVPWPLTDGGAIGVQYYLEGYLKAGCTLSLLAMNTTRHWVDVQQLPALYGQLRHFETIRVDNSIRPLPALRSLLRGTSYHIDRFLSPAYEAALTRLLQDNRFDVVHLDGIFLTPYLPVIRKHSRAKIVLRMHNPEFRIWERLAAQEKNPLKRWYLGKLAAQLKAFEQKHINDYDLALPISKEDEAVYRALGCTIPMYLHPFGVDVGATPFLPAQPPATVYHIGAMDWLPNQESVDWLLEKVWPLVHRQLPQLMLYLAGRNMPEKYKQQTWPNVIVAGEVPDALAFESNKSILAVPLLSGGGVRIKIFKGMAMGKCIVTTPVGVEGIDAVPDRDVLLATTAPAFAQQIMAAAQNPELMKNCGSNARRLMEEKYDAPKLMQHLMARYEELLHAG